MGRRARFNGKDERYMVTYSIRQRDGVVLVEEVDLNRGYERARNKYSSNPVVSISEGKVDARGNRYVDSDLLELCVDKFKDGNLEFFVDEDVLITFIRENNKLVSVTLVSTDYELLEKIPKELRITS